MERLPKFPRIPHLAQWSNKSSDDEVDISSKIRMINYNPKVIVQEKLDGANLAVTHKDGQIIAQNRNKLLGQVGQGRGMGTFQFDYFWNWLYEGLGQRLLNLEALCQNGKYIVYGEWLYIRHTVKYTHLPDYFIVFDIFNTETELFIPLNEVEDLCSKYDLIPAPTIDICKLTVQSLLKFQNMLNGPKPTQSLYGYDTIEGLVIREMVPSQVYKLVRKNFVAGEHWSQTDPEQNTLAKNMIKP